MRWFDHHLKGVDNGIDREPRVRYFTMGAQQARVAKHGGLLSGGTWRTADSWPPPAEELSLYLHGDGSLRRRASAPGERSHFVHDPTDPVPTIGGNIDSGQHLVGRGGQNQDAPPTHFANVDRAPLAARQDVLRFETPPLEAAIEEPA